MHSFCLLKTSEAHDRCPDLGRRDCRSNTRWRTIGAAAGSLFVFKGIYRAVLINYPGRSEKDAIIRKSYKTFSDSEKLS